MGSPDDDNNRGLFLGRTAERDRLSRLIADTRAGSGRVALIEGEPGIGKTRLVEQALGMARALGFVTGAGAADELDRRRPYAAIADALSATGTAAEPVPVRGDFAEGESLLRVVEDLCTQTPVALALEDLHWADDATLSLLARLAMRAASLRLLLVCTRRPAPASTGLNTLFGRLAERGAEHIQLRPLSGEDVRRLLAMLVGGEPGPNLVALAAGTGGNPLFVRELVAALRADGELAAAGPLSAAETTATSVPPSLGLIVLHRMSFLPDATLELLRVASVLGVTFSVTELASVSAAGSMQIMAALREAIAAGVLVEAGPALRFRHEVLREALYDDLAPAIRSHLHAEAARILTGVGASPAHTAEHLVRGSVPGDVASIDQLYKAARNAAGAAPGIAADLLARALELATDSYAYRDAVVVELAMNLFWSGRLSDAERVCSEALQHQPEPATETSLRLCLVQTLMAAGRLREALDEAEIALRSPTLGTGPAARLEAWSAWARMYLGELSDGETRARRALSIARSAGEPLAEAIALATLTAVDHLRGNFASALELADRAVALADTAGPEAGRFPVHLFRGSVLVDLDRPRDAIEAFAAARQYAEQFGIDWVLARCHWISALVRFQIGEWDDALAELEAAGTLSDEIGTPPASVYGHAIAAIIAIHRDELTTARSAITAGRAELARTGPQHRFHWLLWAQALLAEAEGRREDALPLLSEAWDVCEHAGVAADFAILGPDLVRVAVAAGAGARARDAAAAVADLAERSHVAAIEAAALRCRGVIERDVELLCAAVTRFERSPRLPDRAYALGDAAVAAARGATRSQSRGLLDEARKILTGLRAWRDLAVLEARLREAGVRMGATGTRDRPSTGWGALTPTELKVAALVAEGLSDPAIAARLVVSRHTVHTHVSHILAKLGLRSKLELAAAAAGRTPGQVPT